MFVMATAQPFKLRFTIRPAGWGPRDVCTGACPLSLCALAVNMSRLSVYVFARRNPGSARTHCRAVAQVYEHRHRAIGHGRSRGARRSMQRRHLMVEAGTGVGKSFAYLVPAILATAAAEAEKPGPKSDPEPPRRVVISTHTISLQEQLLDKDMPLPAQRLPLEFSRRAGQGPRQLPQPAAAAQCPGPAPGLFTEDEEFDDLRADRRLVEADRRRHAFGPRFPPPPASVGRSGQRSRQLHGQACPHYNDCFYYQARRRMRQRPSS